ncbi:MAG: hypothetical protein AAF456_08260 [Planctomycetota bacterium]
MGLLACFSCSFGSYGMLITAYILGAPVVCYLLLKPYACAVVKWGLPAFAISDFCSLFLLLIGPLLLLGAAVEYIPRDRVLALAPVLLASMTFIWYRSLWLLQQHAVTDFARRTVFVAVLIPAMMLLGVVCGLWAMGTLAGVAFGSVEAVFVSMGACGIVAMPIYVWIRGGLSFVFEPKEKPDKFEPDKFEPDPAETIGRVSSPDLPA